VAHAYTPGLRVTGRAEIEKVRRLPLRGDVVVGEGDRVAAESVVARTALPGNVKTVNVANILGIPPGDIPGCMLKGVGAPVEDGEPLARSKSLFGLFKSTARANTTGTVEHVSNITGQVTLREAAIPVELRAYIDGTVTGVLPGEGVTVRTSAALVQGIFGIGGEASGLLELAVDRPDARLDPAALDQVRGKVVVAGALAGYDLILRARERGAAALVAGGISDADLRRLLGHDLGVAITGSEDVGITVIVTEGFGVLGMAAKTFDLLASLQGRKACVNGATQIRAGVLRPEIIVPLEEAGEAHREDAFQGGLQVGHPVRVIRAPYFGRIGRVRALPPELVELDTGARVRVLEVTFREGEEAVVPRANVEMIEG
jgi:hypothetical protein